MTILRSTMGGTRTTASSQCNGGVLPETNPNVKFVERQAKLSKKACLYYVFFSLVLIYFYLTDCQHGK